MEATTAQPQWVKKMMEQRRLQARCSLLSFVSSNNNMAFMSQVRWALRAIPEELLESVIEELVNDKVLVRSKGSRGAERIKGKPINPRFDLDSADYGKQVDELRVRDAVKG